MMFLILISGETDENCIRNDDIKTDMDLPASRKSYVCVYSLNLALAMD